MLEKLQKKIAELEEKKIKIQTSVKNGEVASVDAIIQAGKDLEALRTGIWLLEEVIHKS